MSFPSVTKLTYSTCSIHALENEQVVLKALQSPIAIERGWRILRREEQGSLANWEERGWLAEFEGAEGWSDERKRETAEGVIRCTPGRGGTIGFFVAGFVRDEDALIEGLRKERSGKGMKRKAEEEADVEMAEMGEKGDKPVEATGAFGGSALKKRKKKKKKKSKAGAGAAVAAGEGGSSGQ